MNIQDALRTFYMVMHFLCVVTSKYIKNLYLYFVKMTSQNIRTYFAKLFFFSNSRRKNKKEVVIVVFEIDIILGQYGHCP